MSLFSAGLLVSSSLFASPSQWKSSNPDMLDIDHQINARSKGTVLKSRKVSLDLSELNKQMGLNSSLAARSDESELVISLPLPEGGDVRVRAEEVSIMAPELAKRFPQIKTWRVIGEDDSNIHGRIDITEHGFHGMLEMSDGDTIFIEPDKETTGQYLSFSRRGNSQSFKTNFKCGVHSDGHPINSITNSFLNKGGESTANRSLARAARANITYRLAVAATGEYTKYHGGTKSKALGAIVSTINRVNEVYERDLSISLELIADEDKIIYTNAVTDPYTNDDTEALIDENLLNLSSGDLSRASYDIGHVFSSGSDQGLAVLGSVCDNSSKAGGVTGIANPIGDAFSIDYVAHEIGHQLGATHTFNSSCGDNRQATAYEPGSGSTIMAYAGICGADNLQSHSDPQFHAVSIVQIENYTRDDDGASCGSSKSTTNQNPEVNAGSDYTIPTQTPFSLTASGSDSDGDKVTYTWEQFDAGTESDVNVDTGDNAIFRSRPESSSPIRYIPRLDDLATGVSVKGEVLAVNDRDVNFVVVARDGKGGISADEMKITLRSTGRPFKVNSHSSNETFLKGDQTTVTWDVAGTDGAPISCKDVNISLIQPSGKNHLVVATSNDGQETITIPDDTPNMTNARFLIACKNNIFSNVSSGVLTVKSGSFSSSGGGGSMSYWLLLLLAFGLKKLKRGK